MKFQLDWPDSCSAPNREFRCFLQLMVNRYVQGHFRYDLPKKRKQYLTRLKLELKAYVETGNVEHLANIANYCGLEIQAPEHPKQHFNAFAPSATRGKTPHDA